VARIAADSLHTLADYGAPMGIAVIGSVGAAIYRTYMQGSMPPGLDPEQVVIATDTLGGALGIAQQLSPALAESLLVVVQSAFAEALHANALIGAAIMLAAAILTAICLREVRVRPGDH